MVKSAENPFGRVINYLDYTDTHSQIPNQKIEIGDNPEYLSFRKDIEKIIKPKEVDRIIKMLDSEDNFDRKPDKIIDLANIRKILAKEGLTGLK